MTIDPEVLAECILLPASGKRAIHRRPAHALIPGFSVADPLELLAANRGAPFPWGNLPEPSKHHASWWTRRLGVGGLIHDKWFRTTGGRFGGAPNVPLTVPGSLRSMMLLDGGGSIDEVSAENEGYALVTDVDPENEILYRRVKLYAATHVMADGGDIVFSPLVDGTVQVGFVGRCQTCPNAEMISFEQLKRAVPEYRFELWPEWRNWRVGENPRRVDGRVPATA